VVSLSHDQSHVSIEHGDKITWLMYFHLQWHWHLLPKMREIHKSTSPSAIQVKNWRKTISTEEKLDTISRLGKGKRIVDICCNVRFTQHSICTVHDNVDGTGEHAK
jgi:hypothetical protein